MSSSSEAQQLSSETDQIKRMCWDSLLCQTRLHPKPDENTQYRTAFEVDYDRLIFSKAFRRLARKTQVHPLATNDHTHNRLTHSLEVASVGRSLGKAAYFIAQDVERKAIPANETDFAELVQAACLAHDIGNTPFGHAGERAIRHWMNTNSEHLHALNHLQRADLTLYEGNAQAFRISTRSVSEFEPRCANRQGGLRLTAATLATMMKYPWNSDNTYARLHGKYSVFQADLSAFEWVANATGLLHQENAYARHPLAFLVEAADDICNAIIDIEDALDLRIVKRPDIEASLLQLSGLPVKSTIAQMRSKAIGVLIEQCLNVFTSNYVDIMCGQYKKPLIIGIDADMLEAFNYLNDIAQTQIYPFQKDEVLEQTCNAIIASILDATMKTETVFEFYKPDATTSSFVEFHQKLTASPKPEYERFMMVMDFVAGMTDNYAANLANKLA